MPRFPAIARASPVGEVAPTSPDYMLAAANYNKWDISRDRNRQARLAAIQDLQQTREQLDSAPTLNLPAPVSSRKTEVQTKIDQLDKQIRQYQEQEIADLREGIALLDRAIPLIDTAPIKSADKREHLREMPLERIQLRAELLMMLRARTKIPGHGGEPDLLGIYRTYSDRTSDAARSFAIEAEVKMRTAKKTTQVLIETAEIQALDLEASSRYLDPEIKLEHDGFNRWIRRCAETQLSLYSLEPLVLQLDRRPGCHKMEVKAFECLDNTIDLNKSFLWACDPARFGYQVARVKGAGVSLTELAAKPAGVLHRIDVLHGLNSRYQSLKLKLSELHKTCVDFIADTPSGLPKKVLDDVRDMSEAIGKLQTSADETLERLLLEAPRADEALQTDQAPLSLAATAASSGAAGRRKPRKTASQPQPRAAASASLAPQVLPESQPAGEPVLKFDTPGGPMLKFDTPDGALLVHGKVTADHEGGEVVEFSSGFSGQTTRYKRRKTEVLNRTVWEKLYPKDRVLAEIEQDGIDESEAPANLAVDKMRSTERHERRLQRVFDRANEFLHDRPAKEMCARMLEREVSYRVTPGDVAAYLGPYVASLDEMRGALDKYCLQLDAATPALKSESAQMLYGEAKKHIAGLQETADALRRFGRDAGIRIFKKQAPTSRGLEFLIEQQVPIDVKITAPRHKLGGTSIQAGEKTTGARLKQTRESPRSADYLTACRLTIRGDETPLCVAHFHYDNPAAEDTDCRAAHLKTVAQERETNRPGPLAQVSAGRRAEVYYAKLESKVVKWILTQAELQKQRQS